MIEIHPAAELFPMLDETELGLLAEDISKNGLHEPIILHHGQVLDGRNRLAACERLGIEPQFVEMNGELESPVLYVISRNLRRRHLSVSQRAAVAAEIMPMLQEEAKVRQQATQFGAEAARSGSDEHDRAIRGAARSIAAKELGVSGSSVQRAVVAKRDNPEGFERVRRGELTVQAASKGHTDQPHRGGAPKIDVSNKHGAIRAEAHKQRMVSALSTATGICAGLGSAEIEAIRSVCDAEEIETWANKSREVAKQFRDFAGKLEGK